MNAARTRLREQLPVGVAHFNPTTHAYHVYEYRKSVQDQKTHGNPGALFGEVYNTKDKGKARALERPTSDEQPGELDQPNSHSDSEGPFNYKSLCFCSSHQST
jgi:hypothetical protein